MEGTFIRSMSIESIVTRAYYIPRTADDDKAVMEPFFDIIILIID